ncbi:MAG: helix-hairpin-helix domain-containing protein [Candidatus Acidiferrales bacterium]
MSLLLYVHTVSAQKHPPQHPLDLNSATAAQLQELPGIGPKTAQAIVDFRARSGPFRRVEDLLAIKGVTQPRLDKIRPYVIVKPPQQKSR